MSRSRISIAEQGYEQLTFFPADSPASLFPLPGSAEARQMTVSSGLKCLELYRKSGPLGCLAKMCLGSSIWNSTACFLTWKVKVTKSKRSLFQLAASKPRISANDYSLWPTPNVPNGGRSIAHVTDWRSNRTAYHNGHKVQVGLESAVKMWPTPKASDYKGSGPAGSKSAEHDRARGNLKGVVMYPTPQAGADNPAAHRAMSGDFKKRFCEAAGIPITGQLNPTWVEWLMGFPLGWTDLSA